MEEEEIDVEGIRIKEHKLEYYECPELVLSVLEERHIAKLWEKGVIIKMLERRIAYKVLENRVHQMWARRGILNIVDLGHEYYLVTFTSKEDQAFALMEGSWLIYDHYLTVRK